MSIVSNEIPETIQEISKKTLALRLQIKKLEQDLDEEEAKLYSEMKALNIEKFSTEFGGYTSSTRKTWKYSTVVEALKEKLDITKKEEENQGVATCIPVTSFKYVAPNTNL